MKHHHPWKESANEKAHFISIKFIHEEQTMNINQHSYNDRYSAHNSHRAVSFFCAAPTAKSVEIVGDFNGWRPSVMIRSVDGWWRVQIELTHGHHQYRFLVDGQPMLDPNATGIVRDDHGERVSLVAVS